MDFFTNLFKKTGDTVQSGVEAVTGQTPSPPAVSDNYGPVGARRRKQKKTKKGGRKSRRVTRRKI